MIKKKAITFILVLSVVSSTLYLPAFAPRSKALFGVGDINIESIPTLVMYVLEQVALNMAQKMVDEIIKDTIDWANSGFEGGPAYVTDPASYFVSRADGIAGEFIQGSDLGFLCSPFQNTIRISLRNQYFRPATLGNPFQCTVSGIAGNLENFFEGRFGAGGGWDTWFQATQNPTNNPYGAFLAAQVELDSRIQSAIGLEREQLGWNQGFRSLTDCLVQNPNEAVIDAYTRRTFVGLLPQDMNEIQKEAYDIFNKKRPYRADFPAEACIVEGPVKTAGATIKTQLDNVLPSGLNRMITADSIEQLLSAFANGLLQRYVFSDGGLFGSGSRTVRSGGELVDIDKDGTPDGWDYTNNGQLDVCAHGLKPELPFDARPSNDNCLLSRDITSSPYFTSMCDTLGTTLSDLKAFSLFLERTTYRKDENNIWRNRVMGISGSVDNLTAQVSRLEVAELVPMQRNLTLYANFLGKLGEDLARDRHLSHRSWWEKTLRALSGVFSLFGPSQSERNEGARQALILQNNQTVDYLETYLERAGRCDEPDLDAVSGMPDMFVPDDEDEDEQDAGPGIAFCSADADTTHVGESVTWSAQTVLTGPNFTWAGEEIPTATGPSVSISYSTTGIKSASVIVVGIDAEGVSRTIPVMCANSVHVTDGSRIVDPI